MRSEMMFKIMVVDDEPEIRLIIKKILEREGYGVVEAKNGADCLENIKKDRPDLILLDVMMPEIDGWKVCREIKNNPETRDIIVCILTVKSSDLDALTSLNVAHEDWHLTKPIDKKGLVDAVKWLLEKSPKKGLLGI